MSKIIRHDSRGDIEILPEPGVKPEPVLVVGFYPVDTSVSESQERDRAVDLVVVFERVNFVVFSQSIFNSYTERVVRSIANAKNGHTVAVQPVAEVPVILGEIRRNKYEVHKKSLSSLYPK